MIAFEQHLLYTKKHLLSLSYHHLFLTTLPGHLPAVGRGIEGGALDAFAIHGVEERHVFALDVDPCTVATPWQHCGSHRHPTNHHQCCKCELLRKQNESSCWFHSYCCTSVQQECIKMNNSKPKDRTECHSWCHQSLH